MASSFSFRADLTPPYELRDAAKDEGEDANHAEPSEERRGSHCWPIAEHGAAGAPPFSPGGDEREAEQRFDSRFHQRERRCAPDPLVKRVAREVNRGEREEDYRNRDERADERMPVEMVAVSVGDDMQNSHDDSSDDRHLEQ